MSINPGLRRQAGLTLMELIVFIMIITISLAGVLTVYVQVNSRSVDPLQRKQAMLLAEALIEEVSLARYTYCHPDDVAAETASSSAGCTSMPENFGPAAGEARPFFNVNDYAGFNPAGPSGKINDVSGTPVSDLLASYQASVTVNAVSGLGPAGMQIGTVSSPPNADSDVLHIAVKVTYGNNQSIVLDRYRTRYAPNSMP